MGIERKDVRGKLDPDLHAALKIICDAEGITEAAFVERVLVPVIERRIHEAMLIAGRAKDVPAFGKNRE